MGIHIKKATKDDMPKVLELIQELANFENEPDAVEVTSEELKEAGFGADPLFQCFLAVSDGEIVGMALIYFRFSTWKGKAIHLEDLVVKENMRGKGIGQALYAEVMKYALKEGVRRVQWEVLDWNERAIKFYERSGARVLKDWWLVQMDKKGIENYNNN
jgi:GNAT superfamily N-acetyltransferase